MTRNSNNGIKVRAQGLILGFRNLVTGIETMLEAAAGEPAITIDENGKICHRADASMHEIVDGLQTLFHMIVRSIFIGRDQVNLKPNLIPGPNTEMRVFFQQ